MTQNTSTEKASELFERGEYDQAIEIFEKNLTDNLSYYYLATAKIQRDPSQISTEELLEVISLYQQSIELSPDFAEAYYMCGMAFSKLTTNLLFAMQRQEQPVNDENIEIAFSTLANYRDYVNTSVKVNPKFKEIAQREVETYNKLHAAIKEFSISK